MAVDMADADDIRHVREHGLRLGLAQVSLKAFRDRPLSSEFLNQLSASFSRIRKAGLKVVLRFQYDGGGGRDAPIDRVLEHVKQLEPVLHENADVIALVQAGFIGAWGEWHSSQNELTSRKSRQAILEGLLQVVPDHRKIQVRSPVFKEQALTAPGLGPSAPARIGYHNDCVLSDETDRGTYPPPTDKWRTYVELDRADIPVGGETCDSNPPRTNCGNAVLHFRKQRWSFLNANYHPTVHETWRSQGCRKDIERDLGYRFSLREAQWPARASSGSSVTISLEVENLGYAVPFNSRPVFLVLHNSETRAQVEMESADPTQWSSEAPAELSVTFEISASLPPGEYSLSLWLPDESPSLRARPEYAIQLANENVWDQKLGLNTLGSIVIGGDSL